MISYTFLTKKIRYFFCQLLVYIVKQVLHYNKISAILNFQILSHVFLSYTLVITWLIFLSQKLLNFDLVAFKRQVQPVKFDPVVNDCVVCCCKLNNTQYISISLLEIVWQCVQPFLQTGGNLASLCSLERQAGFKRGIFQLKKVLARPFQEKKSYSNSLL